MLQLTDSQMDRQTDMDLLWHRPDVDSRPKSEKQHIRVIHVRIRDRYNNTNEEYWEKCICFVYPHMPIGMLGIYHLLFLCLQDIL